MAGYEVLDTLGTMMLGGNLGLGVGVASLNGKMTFGFTADPRLMPDVDLFKDFVAEAFEELVLLAQPESDESESTELQQVSLAAA